MLAGAVRRLGLKLRLSQNVQPPTATVPSTLGQVNPASTLTFCTRWPNVCRRKIVVAVISQPGRPPGGSSIRTGVANCSIVYTTATKWYVMCMIYC